MKKIFILLVLLLSSASLIAEPIGEKRARQIAEDFFTLYGTRSTTNTLSLEWAGDAIDDTTTDNLADALMYIYNRGTNNGFVVVAGDSNIAPIIAYSFDTSLDSSNMAEATRAILDAWCKQVAGARQAAQPVSGNTPSTATRSTDELLYDTAIWNQYEPYNWEAPIYDGYRSVTGCVATAMSIICHYNRWPSNGTGTTPSYSYTDYYGYYRTIAANKLGRTYNYDKMLEDYNNGYTTAQGNAVAALMKDMGTSVEMMYHYSSSGAYDANVLKAFATYFSYSKAAKFGYPASYTTNEWNDILRNNLRNYGPTYYSGQSSEGGHAFVVDGFSGDYFHFNFGWGGYGNGYFLYPEIEYYTGQMALLCLEPDKDGTSTYSDELMLYPYDESTYGLQYRGITSSATSFKQNSTFNILVGTFFNAGSTTFYGDIYLVLTDSDGNVKQWIQNLRIDGLTPSYLSWYYDFNATITTSIEEGDRLRVYYKGQNNSDWQWMRSIDRSNCYDELVLRPTAEEIARNLAIQYDKSNMSVAYYLPYAHDITIKDATTDTAIGSSSFAAYYTQNIDFSEKIGNGSTDTIDLIFSVGDESYTLRLKL